MLEQDRQRYLAQFGVTQWYARELMPGAACSPRFEFAEPEEVVSENLAVSSPSSASTGLKQQQKHKPSFESFSAQRPNIADIAPEPVEKTVEKTAPLSSEDVQADDSERDEKAVCYVGYMSSGISFVAEIDGPDLPEPVMPEVTLLKNIVTACVKGNPPNLQTFQWPPLPHPGLPGHTSENKSLALCRWLAAENHNSNFPIVFFGQVPEKFRQQGNVVEQPGLRQVLDQPILKRDIWNSLRSLLSQKTNGDND
ncbi:hypothetical protein [Hahella ganghwensis]|uniref:hypothetical protein n=1 Tax=Hahella ganghwensis TaxID=286420 RepID=UPI00039BF445|nr:hypothetical protein [Hahella ganghwensis]